MSRLNSVTTRIGPDLRDSIEVMPGLGGIALWVRFLDSDDPTLVARTDGIHVEAGPRYSKYDGPERRFILLHELLHVALAHPVRAREMKKRYQNFDHRLYNIACDAIINTALDGVHGIRAPGEVVTLDKILTVLGQWKEEDNSAEVIRRWSSESLYLAMVRSSKPVFLHDLDADSDLKSEDLMSTPCPIKTGCSETWPEASTEETVRAWNSRLTMARGSLQGIFNRLVRELPKVKTPWERILRDLLFRHSQRKRRPDPSRPTRRWLALEGDMKRREGVDLSFERDKRASRTGRIALAIDTSGSIAADILDRFAAEIASILERTEPQLRLIVSDAGVHQVLDFYGNEGAKILRSFKFKGGGGTDFRPAIAEAAKWKPDLLIYLTDLEGETGSEPGFPVLWAVPEGNGKAPWGKIIELN